MFRGEETCLGRKSSSVVSSRDTFGSSDVPKEKQRLRFPVGSSHTTPRTTSTRSMSTADLPLVPLPKRPGFGKAGTPISLRANHFALDLARVPQLSLYHTSVKAPPRPSGSTTTTQKAPSPLATATPPLPSRLCRAVLRDLAATKKWPAIAFDGASQMIAPSGSIAGADASDGVEFLVPRPLDVPGDGDFTVKIKYAGTVDITASLDAHARGDTGGVMPAAALQALDVVMRHERANDPNWVVVGRGTYFGYFSNPAECLPIHKTDTFLKTRQGS